MLIFLDNQHANIAVNTPSGKSERISVSDIIMQGTVCYSRGELLYKYKGVVEIPSLVKK